MKRRNIFLYLVIAVSLGLMIIPTVIVLAVACIPTGVAFIMHRGKGYLGVITIGAMNMAGATPYLFDLWFGEHTVDGAIDIITNVFAWLVFYGTAMFGWALYSVTPSVVSTFMTMTAGHRISMLREQQSGLVEKWGSDVESVYEPDQSEGS